MFIIMVLFLFFIFLIVLERYNKLFLGHEYVYTYVEGLKENKEKKSFSELISFFVIGQPYATQKSSQRTNLSLQVFKKKGIAPLNFGEQEALNKSKRVRIEQKKKRLRHINFLIQKTRRKFTLKDGIVIFVYVLMPFVCGLLIEKLHFLSEYFSTIIVGVSNHRVDIYLAQLSLTFITISLMSIFSDNNAVIYWENVVKKTLIEPIARCFKAYFWYSFIYLLMSTVSICLKHDVWLGLFFTFNILCLFNLSRTMINCYYNSNRKKGKIVNELIKKIETVNEYSIKPSSRINLKSLVFEINAIFEDFNCYIDDIVKKDKITDTKEALMVYGRLLAHVSRFTRIEKELPVLDWYCEKTVGAYIGLVKKNYEEHEALILGYMNSNVEGGILTVANSSDIINDVLMKLVFNNYGQKTEVSKLLTYIFYVDLLCVVRRKIVGCSESVEALDKYVLSSELLEKSDYKEELHNIISIVKEDCMKENWFEFCFNEKIVNLIGNNIILYAEQEARFNLYDQAKLLLGSLSYLELGDYENIKELINDIKVYVGEKVESLPCERRRQILQFRDVFLEKLLPHKKIFVKFKNINVNSLNE